MKKIINNPADVVPEMVNGMVRLYPQYIEKIDGTEVMVRSDKESMQGKVGIVSGGGSGHEPSHAGFVGKGMLSAAVAGQVFTSPTPDQIYEAIKAVDSGKGVFLVIKNYSGDVMNFDMAKDMAEMDDIEVKSIIVNDDIAVEDSLYTQGRRGVAGTVLMHKILGYYAQKGANIDTLEMIGQHLTENLKTIGVAFSGDNFNLKDNEIYYGIGIHGEPGYRKEEFKSSELLARELIAKLRLNFQWYKGDTFVVLINSLGGTTPIENLIFNNDVCSLLALDNINIAFDKVGTFLSSYGINGISLSLLKVEDADWLHALQAPVNVPAW